MCHFVFFVVTFELAGVFQKWFFVLQRLKNHEYRKHKKGKWKNEYREHLVAENYVIVFFCLLCMLSCASSVAVLLWIFSTAKLQEDRGFLCFIHHFFMNQSALTIVISEFHLKRFVWALWKLWLTEPYLIIQFNLLFVAAESPSITRKLAWGVN